MKMKKVLLTLVVLSLLLCGCTGQPEETTAPTLVTDAPTSPSTVPPTEEQLQWQDLLLEGWQEEAVLTHGYPETRIINPDYSQYQISSLRQEYDGTLRIYLKTQEDYFTLRVPSEYIRY